MRASSKADLRIGQDWQPLIFDLLSSGRRVTPFEAFEVFEFFLRFLRFLEVFEVSAVHRRRAATSLFKRAFDRRRSRAPTGGAQTQAVESGARGADPT